MIPSAPLIVRNNFYQELKELSDDDKYQSVKRYFDTFSRGRLGLGLETKANEPIISDVESAKKLLAKYLAYRNIDPRIDSSKFFYFPTESPDSDMNCLEKSASMYFALEELYPRSNPSLTYLIFDNGSIHATTLFTHKERLHAADPNFYVFGEVQLTNNELIVKEGAEKKEKVYKFKDIFRLSDNVLNQMAVKLRSDQGIVDFVNAGQITGRTGCESLDYLFTYINEYKEIVSEIRSNGKGIRFSGNKRTGIELFKFKDYFWRGINGEEPVVIPQDSPFYTCSPDKKTENYYPMEGIVHFIKHVKSNLFPAYKKQRFLEHPIIKKRFGESLADLQNCTGPVRRRFTDFLMYKFGENPEQIVPLRENTPIELSGKDGKWFDLNMPTMANSFEPMHLKEVLYLLQMSHDAKRYHQEITKQLTGVEL